MKNVKTVFSFALLLVFLALLPTASAVVEINSETIFPYAMDVQGETYLLTEDVSTTAGALTVGADDIIFNGQGHTITYATASSGHAIYPTTGLQNAIIKNINIVSASGLTTSQGIYIDSSASDNITIENVSISVSGANNAIYLYNGNRFYINNITMIADTGIALRSRNVSNSIYTGISCTSVSNYGGYQDVGTNITITDSSFVSTSNYGMGFKTAVNGTYRNITTESSTSSGCIVFLTTVNSTFENISGETSAASTYGLNVDAVFDCDFSNCTGIAEGKYGIFANNVHNCTFTRCTGESNTSLGIYLNNTTGNEFNSCTAISNAYWGIRFLTSSNTFDNMTVTSPLVHTETSGTNVLMIGDSITAGGAGGVVPLGAWRSVFESTLDEHGAYSASDIGWSGETAQTVRARFLQELDIYEPDVITLMYGTNDIAHGRSIEDIVADIAWMSSEAESRGVTTYVMAVTASSVNNTQKIWLNENLSESFNLINVYDAIDSEPENGVYDEYDSTWYVDGDHPNVAGNDILGAYIARNIVGVTKIYYGVGMVQTISPDGAFNSSRDVRSSDTDLPFTAVPNSGTIDVTVSTWSNNRKVWTESSETHDAQTAHIIGGFPVNTLIQINRDGVRYDDVTSNSAGQITWTYTGGYSEHTFEAFAADSTAIVSNNVSTGIWGAAIGMIVVATVITTAGMAFRARKGKLDSDTVTGTALGLVSLCIIVLMGAVVLSMF